MRNHFLVPAVMFSAVPVLTSYKSVEDCVLSILIALTNSDFIRIMENSILDAIESIKQRRPLIGLLSNMPSI